MKENQKREAAKLKEIKAQERVEKRQLKQREMENKKQNRIKDKEHKKKKRNTTPKPKPNDTSPDNTDTEVNYAESEDSYNMEIEQELTDEDIPLSKYSKLAKTYSSGDYVIIQYESEFFPGEIKNVDNNKFEINHDLFCG